MASIPNALARRISTGLVSPNAANCPANWVRVASRSSASGVSRVAVIVLVAVDSPRNHHRSRASGALRSTTRTRTISRYRRCDSVEPGTGSVSMRTQAGTPSGAFFSKKLLPATPLGYRIRVNARSSMCGRSTGDTRV